MTSEVEPERPRLRLGVFAEAFGFGPASKAAAITSELLSIADASVVPMTSSIAHEFLTREGYRDHPPVDLLTERGQRLTREAAASIDVALVVMQPEAASILADLVPVVYVDSLGFMWDREYFDRYEALRQTAAYVVQNAFSSAARIESFGVQNVVAVGALTRPRATAGSPPAHRRPVAHAGGLMNIFSETDGPNYLGFVDGLLRGVVPAGTDLLTSEAVRQLAPSLDVLNLATLSHAGVQDRFESADVVFTSPGMTALLELSSIARPTVPLPPQNLSQALIVGNIAEHSETSDLWRFLAEAYPIDAGIPEEAGVALVRSLNSDFAQSDSFRSSYQELAAEAYKARTPAPSTIVSDFDGLRQTAATILNVHAQRSPQAEY